MLPISYRSLLARPLASQPDGRGRASGLTGKKEALIETVDFIPIVDSSLRSAAVERGDVDIAIELAAEEAARLNLFGDAVRDALDPRLRT